MKEQVTIVGCGVSGLTTGIVLREAGYDARIVTAAMPQDTVSARAAALWFPFQIGPVELVNLWSKIAYDRFVSLAADPTTGVRMAHLLQLIAQEADAWWKDALPSTAIRLARPDEMPAGFSVGYMMQVPIIETPIYLQWLLDRFAASGGKVALQAIHDLDSLGKEDLCIVNCTGLGARDLVGDTSLHAIRGQIVKVAPTIQASAISADMALWESSTELAYIIPRQDCILLGGNACVGIEDLAVDEQSTQGIVDRCAQLDKRMRELPILGVEVGLRPGRKEIRLESEGRVIHNYGHGGGGYTVSWGCAEAVLNLMKMM
jgi:D-amino-acid oxidase